MIESITNLWQLFGKVSHQCQRQSSKEMYHRGQTYQIFLNEFLKWIRRKIIWKWWSIIKLIYKPGWLSWRRKSRKQIRELISQRDNKNLWGICKQKKRLGTKQPSYWEMNKSKPKNLIGRNSWKIDNLLRKLYLSTKIWSTRLISPLDLK